MVIRNYDKDYGPSLRSEIMKAKNESGIAVIMALLILVLMSAMLQVFIVKVISSQKMLSMDMRSERSPNFNVTIIRE